MNLEQVQADIREREELLTKLDINNPLYHLIYDKLIERREKYDLMKRNTPEERPNYVEGQRG